MNHIFQNISSGSCSSSSSNSNRTRLAADGGGGRQRRWIKLRWGRLLLLSCSADVGMIKGFGWNAYTFSTSLSWMGRLVVVVVRLIRKIMIFFGVVPIINVTVLVSPFHQWTNGSRRRQRAVVMGRWKCRFTTCCRQRRRLWRLAVLSRRRILARCSCYCCICRHRRHGSSKRRIMKSLLPLKGKKMYAPEKTSPKCCRYIRKGFEEVTYRCIVPVFCQYLLMSNAQDLLEKEAGGHNRF